MIAVLASRLDPEARALVAAWAGAEAGLLSAEDLSQPGWEFRLADPAGGTAVVEGRRIKVSELRAVLTRRPAVLAEELAHIAAADRAYVAAECNAFLLAWLSALAYACRVVNRPTPTSLSGPAWSELHWRAAAARTGLQWAEPADPPLETHEVVLCGARTLFAQSASQAEAAQALARAAKVELLSVRFAGRGVSRGISGATVAPSLASPEVQAGLLEHLLAQP